jgi:hypothetical protein
MSRVIAYGEHSTITAAGAIITEETEVYANFETVRKFTRQTEAIRVKDEKEILAEFLKLLDRQRAGEITSIAFECIPQKSNPAVIERIKKSWICIQP